jgi:hypothetical protein
MLNYSRKLVKQLLSNIFLYKQKEIIQIPNQLRFGNHLYFFLNCYINQKNNINQYIMHTEAMDYWLNYFPSLREFVIYPSQIKRLDNRKWFSTYFQKFNVDFTRADLNLFINEYLINQEIFITNTNNKRILTINIRRGDFYSNELHSGFRFDQLDYLNKALSSNSIKSINSCELISDDVEWCKDNLNDILKKIIIIDNLQSSPINDFITISNSSNLIITNSTFSYWGGYIAKYLSNDNIVIAPEFGGSAFENNVAIQLHPEWEIIKMN